MTAASIVKLARPGEEAKIFDFFVLAQQDNGFFPISSRKVIEVIMRACRNEGASIGLIKDEKGNIEAAAGCTLECAWYSEVYFLSDLLNFVHPDHRRSKHADALLKFQKDTSNLLSAALGYNVPVIPGILTRNRLEPKIRKFQREFQQVGALFIYNGGDYMKKDDDFFNQKKLEFPKKMNGHSRTAHGDKVMAAAG